MITFLRKLFIKNYENLNNRKVREKTGLLASIIGIITNLILFAFKLLIGILTFSMSIIGDAINNLTDMFSCIANIIGFKLSSKPADKEHPFGHQRIEYISGLIISFFIIIIAGILIYSSIMKLVSVETGTSPNIYTFIILGVAIIAKLFLAYINNGFGKVLDSLSLKAAKQDSLNDCIVTGAVLIASIFQYFFVEELWFLDSAISIAVGLFILYSGIKLVIETADPLIGQAPDKDLVHNIVNEILAKEGVLGVHDVIAHSYGATKTFISLHVEVDGYKNVLDLHDLIDNIEEEIRKKHKVDITIHMDPLDTKNKEIPVLEAKLKEFLEAYNPNLKFHDFRMVKGNTHTNLVFDILLPNDEYIKIGELDSYIKNEFKKINETYRCVIKFDSDYVG